MSGFRQPGGNRELAITTGTTLTITPHDAGKVFTNLGAGGNILYTCQTAANFRPGDSFMILATAAGTVTVAFTAGQLVTFNNAAATSVALSTSSEIIGGSLTFICLSNAKWQCVVHTEETQTLTVA